jgi:predicted AAA+ superfamily ATPase
MKSKINLNINKDDYNINDFLYCWDEFGTRPNKIILYNQYSTKLFSELIIGTSENRFTEVIPSDEFSVVNEKVLVKISDDIFISYLTMDKDCENSIINEIAFFYKDYDTNFEKIQEVIEQISSCLIEFTEENERYKLNTISLSPNGLEMEPVEMSSVDIENFDLYYTDKTMKGLDKVIKSIKKSNKGLTILYGERGTGKTSTINYITTKLESIVIFIPNNMVENTINNPEFRKFLKKHSKPVIVIDDCEMFFNEAFAKSNIFVNNLLQMVDGFLSDSMEVNVITIFNVEDEDEIDHSLIDCNNLTDIVKFDCLTEDESNDLSKHLNQDKKYKNKNRLVDIIKKRKNKASKEIGF